MSNLKAIITKNVGTTLTAAYTNTSGADAALKAYNVNQIGDVNQINQTTGADGWGFIGRTPVLCGSDSRGMGIPLFAKLSTDTLLCVTTPYYYSGSGQTQTDLQVLKYDSATGRYLAGPITRLSLGFYYPIDNNGSTPFQMVAITPTKVAICQGNGTLYTINITNNKVDDVYYTLNASSTFYAIRGICVVPENSNKAVIYGVNAAQTQYITQAINIPSNSAATLAGSAFNAISYSNNNYQVSMALHRRSDSTYMIASMTGNASLNASIIKYTESTNTWATINAATSIITGAGNSQWGVAVVPLSPTGSSTYASAIACGSGGGSTFTVLPQTNGTTVQTTQINTSVAYGTFYTGMYAYNIGDEKAVVLAGNMTMGVTTTTVTNLQTSSYTVAPYAWNLFVPFESRPVYYYTTAATASATVYSRTGLTATGWGTETTTRNYVPFGVPTGKHYMWSDTSQCWFIGFGDNIYALDSTGAIIGEKSINLFASTDLRQGIKCLTVSALGTIATLSDSRGVGANSSYCAINIACNTNTGSGRFAYITNAGVGFTAGSQLTNATTTTLTNTASLYQVYDLVSYGTSTSFGFLCAGFDFSTYPTVRTYTCNTSGSPSGSVAVSTSTTQYGMIKNINLMVTSPTTYIYIGSTNVNGNSQFNDGTVEYTTTPATIGTGTGIYTTTVLDTNTTNNNLPSVSRTQFGMNIIAATGYTNNKGWVWTSNGNNIVASVVSKTLNANTLYVESLASQSAAVVSWGQSTGSAAATSLVDYWTTTSTSPVITLTGTSTFTINELNKTGQYTWSVLGTGIDSVASAYGSQATNFTMTLNNGTSDFYITPTAGTTMAIGSNNRGTDVYYVPNGYSVKIKASIPYQLDSMLEVLEQ
jgi:hypothetical protein